MSLYRRWTALGLSYTTRSMGYTSVTSVTSVAGIPSAYDGSRNIGVIAHPPAQEPLRDGFGGRCYPPTAHTIADPNLRLFIGPSPIAADC